MPNWLKKTVNSTSWFLPLITLLSGIAAIIHSFFHLAYTDDALFPSSPIISGFSAMITSVFLVTFIFAVAFWRWRDTKQLNKKTELDVQEVLKSTKQEIFFFYYLGPLFIIFSLLGTFLAINHQFIQSGNLIVISGVFFQTISEKLKEFCEWREKKFKKRKKEISEDEILGENINHVQEQRRPSLPHQIFMVLPFENDNISWHSLIQAEQERVVEELELANIQIPPKSN